MSNAKAIAIANNDYVHIAWTFGDEALDGCAGFSVHRISESGQEVAVKMFARDARGGRRNVDSDDEPIRKYSWRDVYANREGTFRYRVIPMAGPHSPLAGVAPVETEGWVTVNEKCGDHVSVFFNRGILATQATADRLFKARTKAAFRNAAETLKQRIENPNDGLRKSLSGEMLAALTTLLDRAQRDGGSCWAALYELTDPQLIDCLCACDELNLILANNNDEVQQGGKKKTVYDGKNQPAAAKLEAARQAGKNITVVRRYMPSGHIGHNKFIVYCDRAGTPQAVLTGSTNWTASGLCTQSNNAIIIESQALAQQYLEYWNALRADAERIEVPEPPAAMKGLQGADLRKGCACARRPIPLDEASTEIWFSPNTGKPLGSAKKSQPPPTPADMKQVYEVLRSAKQSVLFLAFMPGKAGSEGSLHFLKELGKIAAARPALFVRGAVSDPALTKELDRACYRAGFNDNLLVVSPQCIWADFEAWREEIYKYGHAVIHDKTIVVDPLSEECVVITGSHNLGFRASSNNDENMLIIRGDTAVAQAYAAHVMDIVEHYRARWYAAEKAREQARRKAGVAKATQKDVLADWAPEFDPRKDPRWQDKYFQAWKPAFIERLFWVSGGQPLPPLVPRPGEPGGRGSRASTSAAASGARKGRPRTAATKGRSAATSARRPRKK